MGFYIRGKALGSDPRKAIAAMTDMEVAQAVYPYLINVFGTGEMAEMIATGSAPSPRVLAVDVLDTVKWNAKSGRDTRYGGIAWRDEPEDSKPKAKKPTDLKPKATKPKTSGSRQTSLNKKASAGKATCRRR